MKKNSLQLGASLKWALTITLLTGICFSGCKKEASAPPQATYCWECTKVWFDGSYLDTLFVNIQCNKTVDQIAQYERINSYSISSSNNFTTSCKQK
jgi:hypothetical protein